MEHWRDNNLSAILEYPFDFERYIEERVREIDDLDERRFAKEILVKGLGKAIRVTEKKYQELECRIYDELELRGRQYEIVSTIVRKEHYDATNRTLFPVIERDLQEKKLTEGLSNEKMIYAGTVFLRIAEPELPRWKEERRFFAQWENMGEKEAIMVCVRPADRYRKEIERLYGTFQDNMIPWETVHAGYLERFFDVFVQRSALPEMSIEKRKAAAIALSELEIDWEEAAGCIEYGIIPLWNIRRVSIDSEKFKEATIEEIFYEHEIRIKDWVETDGYLIEKNKDILEIRHERKTIIVKSSQEEFHNWRVLHITQEETIRSLDYKEALLTNRKRDTFLGRFSAHTGNRLMTKADLFRRIMDLDIREYIKVVRYEIREELPAGSETGRMNWFINGELIPMNSRRILVLYFQALQPDHYLTDSMINFAVSSLQTEFMEYHLAGVRV